MKRSTPLRTRKPLRRTTRLRARSTTNSYRRRARDVDYMRFVKKLPCFVRVLSPIALASEMRPILVSLAVVTPCRGRVEADHMGERGIGQKADDRTCAPLCSGHHGERHAHAGTFKHLTRDELRAWRARAIQHTQQAWEKR